MALVEVISPDGVRGTVDAKDVEHLPDGARVLTAQDLAQEKLEAEYENASTAAKVGGFLAPALPAPVQAALHGTGAVALPPELAAYRAGADKGFTGGLGALAEKSIAGVAGGDAASKAYSQRQTDLETASPIASGAGELAGFAGGLVAGAAGGFAGKAASPLMGGASALGAPIEQGVTKALGGLATKGALGRAATQGAAMGVRGAVEGAAYAGAEQAISDLVHDSPITGNKLYAAAGHGALLGGALGAALGAGGSLASSALSRRATRLALGAEEAATAKTAALEGATEGPYRTAAPKPKPEGILASLSDPGNAARGLAQDQAWKAVGAGFGNQSTRHAKEAAKYFENGTRDLGEIAMRHGLIEAGAVGSSPVEAAIAAAKSGTVADIATRALAAQEAVGAKIGAITDASGARIDLRDLGKRLAPIRESYDKIAGNEHVVREIDSYISSLNSKLSTSADGTVSLQDLLVQRKGLDEIAYRENKALDPARRVQALREVRTGMEDAITDALDAASDKVPGAQKAEYLALKKDYHGLRILREVAEDSAARVTKNATFGLGAKLAASAGSTVGATAGGLVAGPIGALVGGGLGHFGGKLASKFIGERGNAAAAAFLSRASEQGTFDRLIRQFDMKVSKAAAGVLVEAPRPTAARALPSRVRGTDVTTRAAAISREQSRRETARKQEQAQAIMRWHGDFQANPERLVSQIEEAATIVGRSAGPQAAAAYTASTMRAINFIAAHIPVKERRDPLDPNSVPPLTRDESDRLLRATRYALRPETIFEDFEKGIITPEGLRAAKTVAPPESFEQFQLDLQEHVENHMLRNKRLTNSQRLRVDKLLGYPAGAEFKPKALARLQANLMKAPEEPPPAGPSGDGGPAPPPPLNMSIQQTGFDSIEARRSAG